MADLIRLKENLEEMFPGKVITIAEQGIEIKPLGIAKLASISKKLNNFGSKMSEVGITWDNYNDRGNIVTIAVTLLEQFPEVMQDATNIHIDDIKCLPIDVVIELLNTVIEVNLASKESLEKNFKSLAEKFTGTIPKIRRRAKK